MSGDDLTLALIEFRRAASREQQLVTQIRRARREARRVRSSERPKRWWSLRSRTDGVRVWARRWWGTVPGHRPAAWLRR